MPHKSYVPFGSFVISIFTPSFYLRNNFFFTFLWFFRFSTIVCGIFDNSRLLSFQFLSFIHTKLKGSVSFFETLPDKNIGYCKIVIWPRNLNSDLLVAADARKLDAYKFNWLHIIWFFHGLICEKKYYLHLFLEWTLLRYL